MRTTSDYGKTTQLRPKPLQVFATPPEFLQGGSCERELAGLDFQQADQRPDDSTTALSESQSSERLRVC